MRLRTVLAGCVLGTAVAAASIAQASSSRSTATEIRGAGSSFVAPLIAQWVPAYKRARGVDVTYNPIGSGGGIAAITNRNVDFGASDAPLTPDEFRACKGCVQIPWALSATSIAYNLEGGPARIKINGKILADIYLGKIKRWNDARIRALNKGASIPAAQITPVYRSDGSGTTYNFTEYLSKVSPEWRRKVGNSTNVNWPTGLGAARSSGVAAVVSRTNGALTYVDVAYSLKNHLKFMAVQNRFGKFALPGLRAIRAAGATITKVPKNNAVSIVAPPKAKGRNARIAYPICTFTYAIIPLKTSNAPALRAFVQWAITGGQRYGRPLLFEPMPKVVQQAALRTVKRIHS
jgi:phosphate transport system substrate-binding protein